jgi:hypothetical protein
VRERAEGRVPAGGDRAPALQPGVRRGWGNRAIGRLLRSSGSRIQRRLFLAGPGAADVIDLLSRATGLALLHDAATFEVTEFAAAQNAGLPTVRRELRAILGDANHHAQAYVAKTREDVFVGAFPGDTNAPNVPRRFADRLRLPQQIAAQNVLAIEQGAGIAMGAITLMHELRENYVAQQQGPQYLDYETAHGAAIAAENRMLAGTGRRVAGAEDASAKVFDYESFFLVVEVDGDTVQRARRFSRAVSAPIVVAFPVDDHDLPAAAAAVPQQVRKLLDGNAQATVRVVGYHAAGEQATLGLWRARAVRGLIVVELDRRGDGAAAASSAVAFQAPSVSAAAATAAADLLDDDDDGSSVAPRVFTVDGGLAAGSDPAANRRVVVTVEWPDQPA